MEFLGSKEQISGMVAIYNNKGLINDAFYFSFSVSDVSNVIQYDELKKNSSFILYHSRFSHESEDLGKSESSNKLTSLY